MGVPAAAATRGEGGGGGGDFFFAGSGGGALKSAMRVGLTVDSSLAAFVGSFSLLHGGQTKLIAIYKPDLKRFFLEKKARKRKGDVP